MLGSKTIAVVLPGYNCAKTLAATLAAIPRDVVDEVLYVDDCSTDDSLTIAARLGFDVVIGHRENKGYGANQKTCYWAALRRNADVIVMLHPDYQYDPRLLTAMASPVALGVYDVMLGSRILGGGALSGGMPLYKYVANRALTLVQNLLLHTKLSEFHSGYRAFSRAWLARLPLMSNSNDFVFDSEVLVQLLTAGARVGEVSCPTKYFPEASSIDFRRSVVYGLGCLRAAVQARIAPVKLASVALADRPNHVTIDVHRWREPKDAQPWRTDHSTAV